RGQISRLRETDVAELRYRIDGISNLTPMVPAPVAQASYRGNSAGGQFIGTTAGLMDVQQLYPKSGRFLTASDDERRRRVVVLGEQVRKDLELPERPEGEFVQIGTEWFKVVGVMEARGEVL